MCSRGVEVSVEVSPLEVDLLAAGGRPRPALLQNVTGYIYYTGMVALDRRNNVVVVTPGPPALWKAVVLTQILCGMCSLFPDYQLLMP